MLGDLLVPESGTTENTETTEEKQVNMWLDWVVLMATSLSL
jgi:hypothetical protein